MIRILVAEDEEALRILLSQELEEFNLRRIKGKIRELLGRSPLPSSVMPRDVEPRRSYIPRVQMSFAFH